MGEMATTVGEDGRDSRIKGKFFVSGWCKGWLTPARVTELWTIATFSELLTCWMNNCGRRRGRESDAVTSTALCAKRATRPILDDQYVWRVATRADGHPGCGMREKGAFECILFMRLHKILGLVSDQSGRCPMLFAG